ncbi:g12177 [Coccomyxa viridis]|uniref:G12177 protein n=1 Tax=Coccomyxa viridis TaxID=1274662 RepID=A0ABP1G9Q9_9CHLO
MAPLTRSIFKTVVRHTFEQLPDELLIEAELLSLRERELLVQPNQQAIQKTQTVVTANNRTVLAEWLAEVSWDWQLESTIVFKAISYLDNYLSKHDVAELSRFQLVGIACLRAAMGDVHRKRGSQDERLTRNLAPDRFAYISDSTYTEAQVVEMTATIQDCTTDDLRTSPNSKMFLRSFWYRLVQASAVSSEEMHIYTLSSFFLQLTLLDLECSMLPASLLAAASLANSLEVYGKDVWPAIVQQYSAYTLADLARARQQIKAVQEVAPAGHIRSLWRKHHEAHGYDAYQQEWQRALSLVASPCPTPAYLPSSDSLGSATSSQTEGPK